MGLDTSHGCWNGAYSAFNRWREQLAEVAGLPPLQLMEGFYSPLGNPDFLSSFGICSSDVAKLHSVFSPLISLDDHLPIKWECLKPDALYELLHHSDCEGIIPTASCGPIADSLERLLPLLPDETAGGHIGNWREKTQAFIDGLRSAASAGEDVDFH